MSTQLELRSLQRIPIAKNTLRYKKTPTQRASGGQGPKQHVCPGPARCPQVPGSRTWPDTSKLGNAPPVLPRPLRSAWAMPVPWDEPRLNLRLCRCLVLVTRSAGAVAPVSQAQLAALTGRLILPFSPGFPCTFPVPMAAAGRCFWLSPAGPTRPTSGGLVPRCPHITSSLRTVQEILISSPFSNSMLFLGMCITHPALRKTDKLEPHFSAALSGCLRKMQLAFRRGKTYTQV